MADRVVEINRAPVLTLWAAVVAERLGFDWPTALTLGSRTQLPSSTYLPLRSSAG